MTTENITVPRELRADTLYELRKADETKFDDRDKMNEHIGWLICAWDVICYQEAKRAGRDRWMEEYEKSNAHRIQYLVDNWPLPLEDGCITFPDGESWEKTK